ncbi:hypothetical protein Trydic_g12404 [Trypoxylus dichotomus]
MRENNHDFIPVYVDEAAFYVDETWTYFGLACATRHGSLLNLHLPPNAENDPPSTFYLLRLSHSRLTRHGFLSRSFVLGKRQVRSGETTEAPHAWNLANARKKGTRNGIKGLERRIVMG